MQIPTRVPLFIQLLFAGASWVDIILMTVGSLAAIAAGIPFPLMGILFGQLVDDLNGATCEARETGSAESYSAAVNEKVLMIVYIAIAATALTFTYALCWSIAGQRRAQRLRETYFRRMLQQEAAFFDGRSASEPLSRLNDSILAVQFGSSEKVGVFLGSISFFVTAYIIGFIKETRLAGILVSLVPAFVLMAVVGGRFVQKFAKQTTDAADRASSIALEALSNVALVISFGAAPRLEHEFIESLKIARKSAISKAMVVAVQAGMLYFLAYAANALAFWQGSQKIADLVKGTGDGSTVGQIYTVVFLIVDGKLKSQSLVFQPNGWR